MASTGDVRSELNNGIKHIDDTIAPLKQTHESAARIADEVAAAQAKLHEVAVFFSGLDGRIKRDLHGRLAIADDRATAGADVITQVTEGSSADNTDSTRARQSAGKAVEFIREGVGIMPEVADDLNTAIIQVQATEKAAGDLTVHLRSIAAAALGAEMAEQYTILSARHYAERLGSGS